MAGGGYGPDLPSLPKLYMRNGRNSRNIKMSGGGDDRKDFIFKLLEKMLSLNL